jgi:predicted O-methyltransferase YrrM
MDEETLFALMVELHRDGMRQGPGSDKETLRALELTRLDTSATLQVADLGCGTGASTLVLASKLRNAQITAVDLFPEFLDILSERASAVGCSKQIETLAESIHNSATPNKCPTNRSRSAIRCWSASCSESGSNIVVA